MKEYMPRLVEDKLEKQLKATGCVVIEGPKWCGKSTTAKRFSKTTVELQRTNVFKQYQIYLTTEEENVLKGELPILFDEWQKLPDLWDHIRWDLDTNGGRGQYILTGSAKPIENKDRHSGTGRMAKIIMRPMSLYESMESTGEVSLTDLFNGISKISGNSKITFNRIAHLICRGGWPESIKDDDETALLIAENYFRSITDADITKVDDIKRNPERARKILRSYARHISSFASNTTIQEDVSTGDSAFDNKTMISYTNAFRKLFVIEDLSAWSPKLRSKTVIRTADKRQFVDPCIAAAALGASPADLINDVNTFGLLFESLCIRDLRIYADRIGGSVCQYHDSSGLEADAVIHLNNGDWGAVEIKLGGNMIDEAAENLLKLKKRIDTEHAKEPKFLMVLSGLNYAYRRPDGVYVVPIGCLKD
jgi:predicted AAA+ superfamily ATPase